MHRISHHKSVFARLRAICLLLLAFSPATLSQEQQLASAEKIYSLFERGYALLPSSPAQAAIAFEEILRLDPKNITAYRQLGSIYITLGKSDSALHVFLEAQTLFPSDTTQLQIAYLMNSLGKRNEALAVFSSLTVSEDSLIQREARQAAVVLELTLCSDQYPWWWKVYVAPYYDSRFDDAVLSGLLYGGTYLNTNRTISAYGTFSVTHDSRSIGGELPVIYSDNFTLLGGGIRLQPLMGFTTDVQLGITIDLIHRPAEEKINGDVRAVAAYGTGIYPEITLPDRVRWPFSFLADVNASFGYYSRYQNGIGYLQGRCGTRVLEWGNAAIDAYVRVDLAGDTERDFFNNVAEGGVGLRYIPDHRWGILLTAEFHRGTYWGSSRIVNPYENPYNSARFSVILDRFLCW